MVTCPALSIEKSVEVYYTGYDEGDFANFTCTGGGISGGDEFIICLHSGQWSGEPLECSILISWVFIIVISLVSSLIIMAIILVIDFYFYRKRRRRVASKRIPPPPRVSAKSNPQTVFNRPRPFPRLAVPLIPDATENIKEDDGLISLQQNWDGSPYTGDRTPNQNGLLAAHLDEDGLLQTALSNTAVNKISPD